jgi:hypothetical protein
MAMTHMPTTSPARPVYIIFGQPLTSRSGVTEPERRPVLLEEEPVVMRRGGGNRAPPLPSESELLLFFFGSRSLWRPM